MRARVVGAIVGGALLAAAAAEGATSCAPSPLSRSTPVALVLSGGGAKGAYEAGVAAALVEAGVPIRLAAGSSAGALNAAMNAAAAGEGRLDRLEAAWRGMTRERIYGLRAPVALAGLLPGWLTLLTVQRAGALLDPAPLRELIGATLDVERVRRSPVAVVVVTTDLARRRLRVFDNASLTVEALVAAAAVPGAFPPVAIDGALLVDGGLIARAPVLEALARAPGVARALVVVGYGPADPGEPPTTVGRALEEAIETGMVHQIARDVELARLRHPAVEVHVLAPSGPLLLRPLEFDPGGIARALAQGRADAAACVEGWPR